METVIVAEEADSVFFVEYILELRDRIILEFQRRIEPLKLEPLMPWSKSLPADCYSKRRQ